MKEYRHLGVYALIIKDEKIVLIKKSGGPYDGKLDLPGGTIEFGETPEETLKRELLEEVGIEVTKYELFDVDSVTFEWKRKEDEIINHQHLGIFYKVIDYNNEIKKEVEVDEQNDDSLGANFYDINKLKREELSAITIMELEKISYKLQ